MRRQRPGGTWTGTFRVPRSYLARNAELAYVGNVHVAQGRTVDTAHLLVTGTLSRQALYVGMTRGREAKPRPSLKPNSRPKLGRDSRSSCKTAARGRSRTSSLIQLSTRATKPREIPCQNPRPGQACSTAMPIRNSPVPAVISWPSRRLRQARSGSATSAPATA